ncbi:hypothetical protein BBF96_11150 [Anoxybacter fermentans]|uniref:Flagellar biosynthesis protein FlaG n=1 Tax=Anoxybacter fermentans TaxID=1323375 RepID=A0A3Q9HRE4_9FIRM|nr:flagellar protein FlaG [Anoxybacter fermentans]AZR73896.1 hypothetical protein BBF96_11150 [Anoxybacter fermentans]
MNVKSIQNSSSFTNLKTAEVKKDNQEIMITNDNQKQLNFTLFKEKDKDSLKQSLNEITKGLNEMVKIFNRKLDFVIHEDTKRLLVKVIDTETDKVIREIPPEELLDLVARMRETFSIFIDVRV